MSKQYDNNPWIILTLPQIYKLFLNFLLTRKKSVWSRKPSKQEWDCSVKAQMTTVIFRGGVMAWRWRGSSWCSSKRGDLQTCHFHKNSILQEPHWDRGFLSFPPSPLFPKSRWCEAFQSFDSREMAQAQDTMAVLWGNVSLVGENIIAVLGLVPRCRRVVNPPSSWLLEMVIMLPSFPSFFSSLVLSPSFPPPLCPVGLQAVWWGQEPPLNEGWHTDPAKPTLAMAWD